MKKVFIFAAIMLAAMTIVVVSCKKDSQQKVSPNDQVSYDDQDNMDAYLLAFKDKLHNATKGSEVISLEQAQRDLSNLLNFDFGDANYATNVYQHDTLYVRVVSTDNMVDLSELSATYNDAFDQILDSYRILNLEDKSVYSIYCDFENANKNGGNERMRIIVTFRGYIGMARSLTHDTLSWQPSRVGTSCDDPTMPYGGAVNMQHWIMDSQPGHYCEFGGRVYFTDEEDWFKKGIDTYDPIEGRYKIFTIFTNQIDTVCISHEDMEYYFTNILDYYYQDKPNNRVTIETYIDCLCIPYSILFLGQADCYYWRVRIRYGKGNCTNTNPAV